MKKIVITALIILFAITMTFAQPRTWEIGTLGVQFYPSVILHELTGDTLIVQSYDHQYAIHIDSVKYMKELRTKSSYSGLGLIFGIVTGGFAGYTVGGKMASDGTMFRESVNDLGYFWGSFFGMLGGGFLGYAIGHGLGSGKYYNFEKRNHQEKKVLLIKLIAEEKTKPAS